MKIDLFYAYFPSGKSIILNMMRLTFLLFFTVSFGFTPFNGLSQNAKVNLNTDKTLTIDEVFDLIEEQTSYRFVYPSSLIKDLPKVNLKKGTITVKDLLDNSFLDIPVDYEFRNKKNIVLTKAVKDPVANVEEDQQQTITGAVTDEEGVPLPGVNITVEGTTRGTQTDFDGNYTIAAEEREVLVFSYVGFQEQKVLVDNDSEIDISLKKSTSALDEVVVVGYGTQRKKDITGAISSISSEDFENKPVTNAGHSLEGKVAGVEVIRPSGKAQAGFSIRVRGNTSISAGNDPLFVVDGIPGIDIGDINPHDIESITVLKDASSAAIYGAAGANGVVLVETKRGVLGKPTASFESYVGVSDVASRIDVLGRDDYIELMDEIGQTANWNEYREDMNWHDEVYRKSFSQNYQLSLRGGTDKTKYYLSAGWLNESGVVKRNSYNRYNFKVNLDQEVTDHIKIGTSINYTRTFDVDTEDNTGSGNEGVIMTTLTSSPVIGIYNKDGTFTANPLRKSFHNPMATIYGHDQDWKQSKFYGNLYLEANFFNDFTFKSTFGYEFRNGRYNYFLDPFRTDWGRANEGAAEASMERNELWNFQNTLTYKKEFDIHSLEVLAGSTMERAKGEDIFGSTKKFSGIGVPTLNGGSQLADATSGRSVRTNVGFLGRVNYSVLDGRYLLTANFRADGSSVFGPKNKWGYFPSISAGWRISDESFFGESNIVNDLKLRAGWGKVGNDGIGNYAWFGEIGSGHTYIIGGKQYPGISPETPENRDLKWETTTQTNIGLDFSFFRNRLEFSVDAYHKVTDDLLLYKPVPFETGYTSALQNVGEIQNQGIEFTLSSKNLVNKFKWNTDFNISFNKNKVNDIAEQIIYDGYIDNREEATIIKEGLPLGTFWGYKSLGVDPTDGMVKYENNEGIAVRGDDLSDQDKRKIGDANPDFSFGINNSFNYKNWSLDVFVNGRIGGDIFNATRIETESMMDFRNQNVNVLRRWREKGDETNIPVAIADNIENSQISSRFVEDGSFVRLKTLTLSYRFPNKLLDHISLNSANIYLTAENLITITDYSGYDPEVSAFGQTASPGIDYGTFPQTRKLIMGLKFSF